MLSVAAAAPALASLRLGEKLSERVERARPVEPSKFHRPAYTKIVSSMEALASSDSWVRVFRYGETLEGRGLHIIRISDPETARPGKNRTEPENIRGPAVVISEALHGNEYMNIADRLAPWFSANRSRSPGLRKFLRAGGMVYVVPVANPDGYEKNSRRNPQGIDLNRTFVAPFEQVETASLARWIDQDLALTGVDLELAVDYHCCKGSLIYPLPTEKRRFHRFVGLLVQHHIDAAYTYGTTPEILGYQSEGTAKDYWYGRYGALSFTYEGETGKEHLKFDKHTIWWDRVFAMLADKKRHLSAIAAIEGLDQDTQSARPILGNIPFLKNLFLPPELRAETDDSGIQVEE